LRDARGATRRQQLTVIPSNCKQDVSSRSPYLSGGKTGNSLALSATIDLVKVGETESKNGFDRDTNRKEWKASQTLSVLNVFRST